MIPPRGNGRHLGVLDLPARRLCAREERGGVSAARIGDQRFAARRDGRREERQQRARVAFLVEDVGGEDQVEGQSTDAARRKPVQDRGIDVQAVRCSVPPEQIDAFHGPVGRTHLRAHESGCERRQAQTAPELEHALSPEVEVGDLAREHDPGRPQVGPVREELVGLEPRLVDQAVWIDRTSHDERERTDADRLVDGEIGLVGHVGSTRSATQQV